MPYLHNEDEAIPRPAPTPPPQPPAPERAPAAAGLTASASRRERDLPAASLDQVMAALRTHRCHAYQDTGRRLTGWAARRALYSAAFIARRLNAPEPVIQLVAETVRDAYLSSGEAWDLKAIVAEAMTKVEPVGPKASLGRPRRTRRPHRQEEVAAFAEERLYLSADVIITSAELAEAYAAWAERKCNRPVLPPHALVRRLRQLYPTIETRRLWRNGRMTRGLAGVGITKSLIGEQTM